MNRPIKTYYFKHTDDDGSSEYGAWKNMIARCKDKTDKNYGGRGITVCVRWRSSFVNFIKDVGRKPSPGHSIDRYPDNNGNYELSNFRWATASEQSNNKRNNIIKNPMAVKIYAFKDQPDLAEALRIVVFKEKKLSDSDLIRSIVRAYPPIAIELKKLKLKKIQKV